VLDAYAVEADALSPRRERVFAGYALATIQ
jgi:hypothetical protein